MTQGDEQYKYIGGIAFKVPAERTVYPYAMQQEARRPEPDYSIIAQAEERMRGLDEDERDFQRRKWIQLAFLVLFGIAIIYLLFKNQAMHDQLVSLNATVGFP